MKILCFSHFPFLPLCCFLYILYNCDCSYALEQCRHQGNNGSDGGNCLTVGDSVRVQSDNTGTLGSSVGSTVGANVRLLTIIGSCSVVSWTCLTFTKQTGSSSDTGTAFRCRGLHVFGNFVTRSATTDAILALGIWSQWTIVIWSAWIANFTYNIKKKNN